MTNFRSLVLLNERPVIRNSTLAYFSSFIILGIAAAILGPSLPYLADRTGTLISEISSLFATRSGGYLMGSWIGGQLYDRFSGHRVLGMGLLLMVVILIMIPVQPLLWVLAAAVFLLGMAEASIDVGGNALLVWLHKDAVGPYMNALHAFFGVGAFLAPLFIALSLQIRGGITAGYWLLAFLVIPVFLWVFRLPSPGVPSKSMGRDQIDNGKTAVAAFLPIVAIMLLLFLYVGAEVGFGGWVYTYALEMKLADESIAAYITSAFWGAFTIARFYSITLAARLRPRTMLIIDLSGGLISIVAILLWPQSQGMLWVGAVGLGASLASIFPTAISLAERRYTLTAKITSWFFIAAGVGGMVFPWLMGQFFDMMGPRMMIKTILVILALMALLVFVVAAQPHKGKQTS